ncbi:hypothetical protein ACO0LO_24585 [Undibacterium sp. TJN25]|uniref:hypothetical protein n=1 Tax=Undibacterium sp. TJN25 TaxID=3413056 RepID=UPI003BF10D2E
MTQASVASEGGQPDKAVSVLKNAANLYPADKAPWLRMAQLNFDSANYGGAITNALEVLQRDASDNVANSIIAVSGLRLSTKALADLSQRSNLTGSVRTEAQDLAKLLRESLGETVLVPTRGKPAVAAAKPAVAAGAAGTATAAAVPRATKGVSAKPPVEAQKADSNPFGSLK